MFFTIPDTLWYIWPWPYCQAAAMGLRKLQKYCRPQPRGGWACLILLWNTQEYPDEYFSPAIVSPPDDATGSGLKIASLLNLVPLRSTPYPRRPSSTPSWTERWAKSSPWWTSWRTKKVRGNTLVRLLQIWPRYAFSILRSIRIEIHVFALFRWRLTKITFDFDIGIGL